MQYPIMSGLSSTCHLGCTSTMVMFQMNSIDLTCCPVPKSVDTNKCMNIHELPANIRHVGNWETQCLEGGCTSEEHHCAYIGV